MRERRCRSTSAYLEAILSLIIYHSARKERNELWFDRRAVTLKLFGFLVGRRSVKLFGFLGRVVPKSFLGS